MIQFTWHKNGRKFGNHVGSGPFLDLSMPNASKDQAAFENVWYNCEMISSEILKKYMAHNLINLIMKSL